MDSEVLTFYTSVFFFRSLTVTTETDFNNRHIKWLKCVPGTDSVHSSIKPVMASPENIYFFFLRFYGTRPHWNHGWGYSEIYFLDRCGNVR